MEALIYIIAPWAMGLLTGLGIGVSLGRHRLKRESTTGWLDGELVVHEDDHRKIV